MVRIALRVYNNEIGDLINHGKIEEAIAHCRHILKAHPKHVDTYRLLGKAYLEAQQYSDAADILQRVLSSAPEDFTAHVGMSIIREGENELDTAIFHMERAFDSQPSNQAIQDELRRLFSRRDGMEPHKIRLTRGALARMYAHGNLYEQAIAELLAALSEDPQRYELQVLLANMYYQSGKKAEAAEICAKTLEKLSFCLEANRLLFVILKDNGREEDAKIFYQRWVELDPYAAHLSDNLSAVDQLQDQVVTIERLEWEPSGGGFQPAALPASRSSLGVSINDDDTGKQAIPDWLAVTSDEPTGISAPTESEPLPDWKASTPDVPASTQLPEDTFGEDPIGGEDLPAPAAEAEISTDWMAALDNDTGSSGNADWMADFESQDVVEPQQPAGSSEGQPDWMPPPEETDAPELTPIGKDAEDQPDFLESLSAEPSPPAADSGGDDDWLSSLQADSIGSEFGAEDQAGLPSLGEESGEPASAGPETAGAESEIPDFLKESGWSPSSGEAGEPAAFADPQNIEEADTPKGDVPDWMQEPAPTKGDPVADDEAGGFSAVQSEADPDWLQSVQPQTGNDSPDWLEDIGQGASESGAPSPPPATGDAADFLADLNAEAAQETSGGEIPAADSLAALTQPDAPPAQAADDTEDWLAALGEDADSSPEAAVDPGDFPTTLESPTLGEEDSSLDWPNDLNAEAAPWETIDEDPLAALTQSDEPSARVTGNTEDWLASLGEESDSGPEEAGDSGDFLSSLDAPSPGDDDAGLDWLADLSAEAAQEAAQDIGLGETPAEDPLAALTQPDEAPTQTAVNTEEWLASLGEDTQSIPETAGDPGDFLSSLDTPSQGDDDSGLDWLTDLSAEAAQEAAAETSTIEASTEDPLAALAQPNETSDQDAGDTEDWVASLRQEEQFTEVGASPEWDNGDQQADLAADSVLPAEDRLDTLGSDQPDSTTGQTADEGAAFEEDAGLAWLESLAAKQGVAEEELITPHDDRPTDTPDWAQEQAEEIPAQPEPEAVITPPGEHPGEISSELDKDADGEGEASLDWLDDISAEAAQEASSKDEQQWLDSLRDFDAKLSPESETPAPMAPSQDDVPIPSVEDRVDNLVELVPDSIQDVIGQTPDPNGITDSPEQPPEKDESVPGFDVEPTQAEEWLPETEVEDHLPVEPEPVKVTATAPPPFSPKTKTKTTAKKGKRAPEDLIADARQDMRGGSLDLAIDQYGKLIQKGKLVDEVITDIEEALRKHPINVGLWQILGDAYMRLDRLQDALDSYSKAEDLLT